MEANYAHQQKLDMIPLKMQKGYSAKGWLGLILGTRMWYSFWDADQDDDAAFERRLDAVIREIGDRGKLMLPEAVTPFREPTPAPAPAPKRTPAPAPVPVPAPAPTSQPPPATQQLAAAAARNFSPSMQSLPAQVLVRQEVAPASSESAGSFSEMVSFMREERETMMSAMEQQRQDAEAKLEAHRHEAEAQKREADARASAKTCVSEAQLEALQARLDALHQAKLLTDDEVFKLEDCVADFIECSSSLSASSAELVAAAEKVRKLAGLSERVVRDGMLARQLRRKFA